MHGWAYEEHAVSQPRLLKHLIARPEPAAKADFLPPTPTYLPAFSSLFACKLNGVSEVCRSKVPTPMAVQPAGRPASGRFPIREEAREFGLCDKKLRGRTTTTNAGATRRAGTMDGGAWHMRTALVKVAQNVTAPACLPFSPAMRMRMCVRQAGRQAAAGRNFEKDCLPFAPSSGSSTMEFTRRARDQC